MEVGWSGHGEQKMLLWSKVNYFYFYYHISREATREWAARYKYLCQDIAIEIF